jgi:general stress protein 26
MTNDMKAAQLSKFKNLVEDVKTCMMMTSDINGKLNARPMNNAKVEEDGSVWFFTNEFSGKVAQISHQNEIFLTYASPSANSYVAFNAKAELSDDKNKIDELWTLDMKAWFPDGKEDPKILLIHAKPIEAEYWDHSSSKIIMLFNMIKSAVTGNYTEGEHAKLKL